MKRPPDKVIRGLRSLASLADAGGPADMGIGGASNDSDELDARDRKRWADICAAVAWIWNLPATPATKEEEEAPRPYTTMTDAEFNQMIDSVNANLDEHERIEREAREREGGN